MAGSQLASAGAKPTKTGDRSAQMPSNEPADAKRPTASRTSARKSRTAARSRFVTLVANLLARVAKIPARSPGWGANENPAVPDQGCRVLNNVSLTARSVRRINSARECRSSLPRPPSAACSSARASIWRIRSLVTPISAPTCFERQRLLAAIEAEAADDNLLLALVKPFQNLADLRLPLLLGALLLELVATGAPRCCRTSPRGWCGTGRGGGARRGSCGRSSS